MSLDDRLQSHYESLDRAIGFTRTADAKAAPVLAIQAALIGTLAARAEGLQAVLVEGQWWPERVLIIGVMAFYMAAVVTAVVLTIKVYLPSNPRTGKSLIYFEDIAAQDYRDFGTRAKAMRSEMIESQLLDQIHRVSRIASRKMQWVRWALWSSVVSGAFWLVLLAWGSVD